MPKRHELKKVVILGSGPIVIGQACEFDYSGTQACKALMAEGLEVVLINSNPATIMTDPEIATRVYIEPLKLPFVKKILERERPDAIIPTLGGQTALNLGLELHNTGVLKKLNIEMIGAKPSVIEAAENREKFSHILKSVGAQFPRCEMVRNFEQGQKAAKQIGFPIILRPNYTLGGGGGGIAYSNEEYETLLVRALSESPTSEVLVEESILGWKEYELEVMRDSGGTFVVICSIENLDPCGVHTGDSITVAPQQTLSEVQYQDMRDEARKIVDAVGLECGGANVQFAVHPKTGRRFVIEMNPRVSRSSALASKATGFPIAKISALLAIGYQLEEIQNDITKSTPSCFEPALDYVVVKVPRFAFEKFHGAKDVLSTQMKSVGEVMSLGRTFLEAIGKSMASLEFISGFDNVKLDMSKLSTANSQRWLHIGQALREGMSVDQLYNLTQVTPWFLLQLKELIQTEAELKNNFNIENLLKAKRCGISDKRIAKVIQKPEVEVREFRYKNNIHPAFYQVDTCAGEFASETPYYYSTYWSQVPLQSKSDKKSVFVLGSGPNRIGQGIEFDYCCVRGVQALKKQNLNVVMINSNPETVSTDYDTADQLFFEPLTTEHILEINRVLHPIGVVAQLGGQTPISLADSLVKSGMKLMGSSMETIDLAEDRSKFKNICEGLGIHIPKAGLAKNLEEAKKVAAEIGYPLICRPSYVLGGSRMEVISALEELETYFQKYQSQIDEKSPCFMDQFLEGALELDVDIVRGVDWQIIGGVIEHIEAAGVHSGDSMGVIPPQRLKKNILEQVEKLAIDLANKINVVGHMNIQLAIKKDLIYMIEANPRCSRTVPFLAKATGIPLVDFGVLAMLGKQKSEISLPKKTWQNIDKVCVKGVVFPFKKFPEADAILGPEMKSTGESMGRGHDYSEALLKAFLASNINLPESGEVFLSLREKDKKELLPVVKKLVELGFTLSATSGTASFLYENGVDCIPVKKVHEGRPHCVDRIRSGKIALVINTTSGRTSIDASFNIRRSCIDYFVPCVTEDHAAHVLSLALQKKLSGDFEVYPL